VTRMIGRQVVQERVRRVQDRRQAGATPHTFAFAGKPPAGSARETGDSPGIVRSATDRQRVCSLPAGPEHDRYLAQFQWVRSYVMEGGHLLLETMADGSIVEFEPTAGAAGN
jgi:hypothetical protein